RGVEPNVVVLVSALQACEAIRNLENGKRIHELVIRKGLDSDILVSTALIDMYMNCGCPDEAIEVFESILEKDCICFSSLLHGCVQNGRTSKSIGVFCDMLANGFQPDVFDVVNILTSCSELGVLQQTSCIHGIVIRNGMRDNSFISASLMESYAKCGSLNDAIEVFRQIKDRDVVIWSSMFAAYGIHGKGEKALEFHAGLVKEGIWIFDVMVKDYQITPNAKHYGIVVDLLGRIGELDKAKEFISRMPQPIEANIWGALLGSCRIYENTEIGEIAAKELQQLDPLSTGHYVLLSNMYAVDEKWINVAEVRNLVKEKKLKKVLGQSVVEIRDEVCTFIANDRSHQDWEKIHELLTILEGKMKEEPAHEPSDSRVTPV
ncbi:hypothetical protein CDL12_30467, partial [Handroanthus impetiginosus]